MADQFTEVTTKSWGSRLGSSFGAIIGSFVLFVASFGVLFWNEGRVDMSTVAATAQEASAENIDASLDGQLVSVTGQVTTPEMIGDGLFLAPGNYLGVMRSVEMYAWEEKTSSSSEVKVGGSEETKTTYTYEKRWTSSPKSSSTFKVEQGHSNPPLVYDNATVTASEASIGAYTIYPEKMALPAFSDLSLTEDMIPSLVPVITSTTESGTLMGSGTTMSGAVLTESGATMPVAADTTLPRLVNNSLYIGAGSPTSPQIGDVRITYKVLQPGLRATVFGEQEGSTLTTHAAKGGTLYSMHAGNREEAIKAMHDSHVMTTWILRLVGFLMMWGGLAGVFAPINVLLDVLPFLGSLSRSIISFVTFIVALILSVLTILISMLLHNIFLVILLAIAGLVGAFMWLKSRSKKAAA